MQHDANKLRNHIHKNGLQNIQRIILLLHPWFKEADNDLVNERDRRWIHGYIYTLENTDHAANTDGAIGCYSQMLYSKSVDNFYHTDLL
jgi:hypothetical protein